MTRKRDRYDRSGHCVTGCSWCERNLRKLWKRLTKRQGIIRELKDDA